MADYLIVQRGPEIGKRIAIKDGTTTLGRSNDNDVELSDPYVSRYHSVIKKQGNEYILIDLGSENPVQIRDTALEPGQAYTLKHRDVIRIGQYVFSYQSEAGINARTQEAAAAQAAPPVVTPTPENDAGATQVFSSSDRQALLGGYQSQAANPVEHAGASQSQSADWQDLSPDATIKNAAYQSHQPASPAPAQDEPKLTSAVAPTAPESVAEPVASPYSYNPATPYYENIPPVPSFESANPPAAESPYSQYGMQNQYNQYNQSANPYNQYDQPPATPGYSGYAAPDYSAPASGSNQNQNQNQSSSSANYGQTDNPNLTPASGYGYTPPGQPVTPPAASSTPATPPKAEVPDMGDAPTVIGTNYAELIRQYKEQAQAAQQSASAPAHNPAPAAQPDPYAGYGHYSPAYSSTPAHSNVPEEDSAATMIGDSGVNYAELLRNTPHPAASTPSSTPASTPSQEDNERTMISGNFPGNLSHPSSPSNQPVAPNYGAYGQNYNSYSSPGTPAPGYSDEAETRHSSANPAPANQPPVQPSTPQYGYPQAQQPVYDPNQYGQYNQSPGQPPVDYNQYGQPNYNQYGQPNYNQYGQPNYNQYGQPQSQPPAYNQYGQPQPAYDMYGQPVPPPPSYPAPEAHKDPKDKDKPAESDTDTPTAVIRIDKTKP